MIDEKEIVDEKEIWFQQIRASMLLIKHACEHLEGCKDCPLAEYCPDPLFWDTREFFGI